MMIAIASGEWDEQRVTSWLKPRLMLASTHLSSSGVPGQPVQRFPSR
ncbi:MAG: hypothetical protein M1131_07225 [Actinobacteria bacterium]|nr:hypothetical protein [Actinomycetota bacterium]